MTPKQITNALNHDLRRRMVSAMLSNGRPFSPADLARALEEPIGNVSYHMRFLLDQGAVKLVDTRQRRGAIEHFYEILPSEAVRLRNVLTVIT